MSPIEIMEDFFFIERGYLNGNHFVYRAKEPVLIDTGYLADYTETARLIVGLGIQISDIRLIITTHCHCDHVGGNKIIQDKSGCDIALHEIGKYFIDTKDDWSTWWSYYRQEADFFRCTRALKGGGTVFVGPHEFEIIHTPGHASDGIVLYNRDQKILISSDTLWENELATITVRVEGSTAVHFLLESLEKLASLDVHVVYPGHGKPFKDFKGALKRSERKAKDYLSNRETIGNDLLRKITVYTLLMKKSVPEKEFFALLMDMQWFKETVDLYFESAYEAKYNEIMSGFLARGVLKLKNSMLYTTVKP